MVAVVRLARRSPFLLCRLAVLALTLVTAGGGFAGEAPCPGDCNEDGQVLIAELIRAVNIALLRSPVATCPAADEDGDRMVGIAELIRAVNAALNDCAAATPTAGATATPAPWSFTEVAADAGVRFVHSGGDTEAARIAGGAAAGDYDGDSWIDLYVAAGETQPNLLLRNRGDGTFENLADQSGLPTEGMHGAAYTFADIDGDGTLDLFLGGVDGARPRVFGGQTNGVFTEETGERNFGNIDFDTYSAALADYDRDGDLDICLSHWGTRRNDGEPIEHLYRNDGDWSFQPTGIDLGVVGFDGSERATEIDTTFTPSFADLDGDGWQDLVFASDFENSQVFLNDGSGLFRNSTTVAISDENGMGSALGDFDNDGDIDWFVSSVWDPDGIPEGTWGVSGNRLYENLGNGTFSDATDRAGVREGFWGWGSCFADFNNDGHLDLFHVNGFRLTSTDEFTEDPSRLYINNGDATFSESSELLGLVDTSQGRGIVCFDYDRDGDIDVFIAANDEPSQLWRNDGGDQNGHYLGVRLRGRAPNTQAIGARITLFSGDRRQIREIRAGNNFTSQNPAEAHFGLGIDTVIDRLRIRWPRGEISELSAVAADQMLVVEQP